MRISRFLCAALLAAALGAGVGGTSSAARSADEDEGCGIFPAEILDVPYAGMSGCFLKGAGEKPLWKGPIDPRFRQQIRFTFTEGHMRYVRVIDFTELVDGSGRVERKTIIPGRDRPYRSFDRRRQSVSASDVRRLNELAAASGTWTFTIGTWDGDDLYLHCETLEMERLDASDYRFSIVNISCKRPTKLEPMLIFLTELAGLEPDGTAY